MTLRIAYMTGEYPRATDTFIQREVAALREQGVYIDTFSIRKPADKETVSAEQQAERDRTAYVLPICPLELLRSHVRLLTRSPTRYLSAMRTALTVRPPGIKALLRQFAYFAEAGIVASRIVARNLSHLHNHFSNSSCSVAMLASEMGRFTYSFTMHGPAEFFEPKYWRVEEKIGRAKFVCCISHFCRSQAMVFAPQEKWDRLHIVHCGVDPQRYGSAAQPRTGRRLLFVGRLAAVKGLPVLLDAMSQICRDLPDVRLTLAGDGPDRAQLERRARELGIAGNVHFIGYQSPSQVAELLEQTDVFTMASFAEGVPVVLMEAMAAGVPVVATRIAGIPELVDDSVSGFLVPPGDSRALAQKVLQLLADAPLRARFATAGREKVVREFSVATESRRLCQILAAALEGRVAPVRPELASDAEIAKPAKSSLGAVA